MNPSTLDSRAAPSNATAGSSGPRGRSRFTRSPVLERASLPSIPRRRRHRAECSRLAYVPAFAHTSPWARERRSPPACLFELPTGARPGLDSIHSDAYAHRTASRTGVALGAPNPQACPVSAVRRRCRLQPTLCARAASATRLQECAGFAACMSANNGSREVPPCRSDRSFEYHTARSEHAIVTNRQTGRGHHLTPIQVDDVVRADNLPARTTRPGRS